jgi:hypothetical protein
MVKYERIAIVNLVQFPNGPPCEPDRIWARMAGNRSESVRPGNGIAMLWGRIYEEGNQLFIQSYLRFARAGAVETIQLSLPLKGGDAVFRGSLPTQAIAFAPRRISHADIAAVTEQFARSAQVYERPDETSPVVRVAPDPRSFEPFGYHVTEVRGDWMRVSPLYGGAPGWLHARVDASMWPLRERLPELHFLDAVVGYLEYRVAAPGEARGKRPGPARFIRYAQQSLAQFTRLNGRVDTPAVSALGESMIGALQFLAGEGDAASHFGEAARLLPYSGELRNLQNVARLSAASAGLRDGSGARAFMADLLSAVATEPDNAASLQNLAGFHRLLQATPAAAAAINPAELARQQAVLKTLLPPR